MIPNKTMIIQL